MDFFTPFADRVIGLLSSQAVINAVHAVFGGLMAAIAFGRKNPVLLIGSALLAGLVGYMLGSEACELVMGMCGVTDYKAFSFGVGTLSWPMFLVLPKIPDLVVAFAERWIKK